MSAKALQIAGMLDMLPESEQDLAFELMKRLVLAWDPDYVKLTPAERIELEEAENDEYIEEDTIDWNNLGKYTV